VLAVSAVGDTIATADSRGVVRIWQGESLAILASIETQRSDARSLAWHADGRRLWMSDGGGMRFIDSESGDIQDVPLSITNVSDLAISADGRWLVAVTELRRLTVFDLPRLTETIDGQTIGGDLAVSPSERLPARVEPLAAFDMPGLVSKLAWSDSAALFAATDDSGTVGVWAVEQRSANESATVKEIWKSVPAEGGLTALAWSHGELLLGDGRGWLTSFDAARLRTLWRQPTKPIREIITAPSSDNWLVIEQGDGSTSVWDRARLNVGRPIAQGNIPIRSVALSHTGRHAAWRDIDGRITVFDVQRGTTVTQLEEPSLGATAIAWNPGGNLLAIGRSGGIILFEPQADATRQRFAAHQGTVWALAFSADGKLLASGAEDGTAMITNLATGQSRVLKGHQGEVRAVAFSQDGKSIATADAAATVRLFDLEGRLVFRRELSDSTVNSLAFMAERSLAIAEGSGRISILDANHGDARRQWQAHHGAVWSLATVGDQLLSAGQDGIIALWDSEGELELSVAHLRSPVWGLAGSSTANRFLACTTAGDVHEWTW